MPHGRASYPPGAAKFTRQKVAYLAASFIQAPPIWTLEFRFCWGTEMGRQVAVVLHGAAMVAIIIGVDVMFFKNHFYGRLAVNLGIVLVFGAFYFRFLSPP